MELDSVEQPYLHSQTNKMLDKYSFEERRKIYTELKGASSKEEYESIEAKYGVKYVHIDKFFDGILKKSNG